MFEELQITQYNKILADKAPTPGGGSALAVIGAIACSLVQMTLNITIEKTADEETARYLREEYTAFVRAQKALYRLSDDDAAAFDGIVTCLKMPKSTPEEQKTRQSELQKRYHRAALVPLDVMAVCKDALRRCKLRVMPHLSKYVASDSTIAADLFATVIRNSAENVYANTCRINDSALRTNLEEQCRKLTEEIC